jgi:hypothetical protein
MPKPEDFDPLRHPVYWPAILTVFAVQMIFLIAVSIAVVNHPKIATASATEVDATALNK